MRRPSYAGQFYPGEKEELKEEVISLLKKVRPPTIPEKIRGIIVPHAGYEYSGEVAAYAYKAISGDTYQTVIMLGPSHRASFRGFALYAKGKWSTPLGATEIDEELANDLLKSSPNIIKDDPAVHNLEHSLEVQLPFLQTVLKGFKILPVMMLFPSYEECLQFAQTLAKSIKDRDFLLLVSTDLYHGDSYEECLSLDKKTLSFIERIDPKGLYSASLSGDAQACGSFPLVCFLLTLKELGIEGVKLLKYTNSNEVMGTRQGYCVGYSSFLFYPKPSPQKEAKSFEEKPKREGLSLSEKKELLRIARTTLEKHIRGEKVPEFTPLTERLKERCGVFVTLKKKGELRGCIGYIQGVEPLYQAVSTMAIQASTQDPRFLPVQEEELKDIKIEITVLSPLRKISDIKEIEVGRDGIYIRKGLYSGLLLPQVAIENNWNREQFLAHTCLKAGLAPSAWKDKESEIYIFTGEIFQE